MVIKNPEHLGIVNHFLEDRADILTFTLPLFTKCRKPKGENANENTHSHWSYNTRETFGSVAVAADLGVSNPEKIFLYCSMNRSVAGWLCCVAGKRLLQTVSAEGCHRVIRWGNSWLWPVMARGAARNMQRTSEGHIKGIHLAFFLMVIGMWVL